MQKSSTQTRKERKTSSFSQRPTVDSPTSSQEHWDTPITEKITLLDWYWLLEDEADDLNSLNLCHEYCSSLLQNCVDAYVKTNAVPYTIFKIQDEILQFLSLIKKYPDTLKPSFEDTVFDVIEPAPSDIDSYACGWPKPVYDPNFKPSKSTIKTRLEKEPDEPTTPSQQKSTIPLETEGSATHSSSGVTSSIGQKGNKKKLTSVIHLKKRKTSDRRPTLILRRKSAKSTMRPFESEHLILTKKKVSRQPTNARLVPPSKMSSSTSSSDDSGSKTSEKRDSAHSLVNVGKLSPPKPHKQRSTLGIDLQTSIPSSITFEQLETSNFPFTRIKTGYAIKDVEVVKEVGKLISLKRSVLGPKRGVDDSSRSTIGTTNVTNISNIFTMPPVAETMTNIGGGVLVRSHTNYKIKDSKTSMASDIIEPKPLLRPISRGKMEPQFPVSQLIDRSLPIMSRTPKY